MEHRCGEVYDRKTYRSHRFAHPVLPTTMALIAPVRELTKVAEEVKNLVCNVVPVLKKCDTQVHDRVDARESV